MAYWNDWTKLFNILRRKENVKEETLPASFFIFEQAAVKCDPKYYQTGPQRNALLTMLKYYMTAFW